MPHHPLNPTRGTQITRQKRELTVYDLGGMNAPWPPSTLQLKRTLSGCLVQSALPKKSIAKIDLSPPLRRVTEQNSQDSCFLFVSSTYIDKTL